MRLMVEKYVAKNFTDAMEEHFRNIWIEKWIESILELLQQIDEKGVEKYFHFIGANKNLTLEYIDEHLIGKMNNNYYYVSSNPHLTFEYVTEHIDQNWNWCAISKHPNITLDMILSTQNNPKYKWNMYCIVQNPNITHDILTTHDFFANRMQEEKRWIDYCHNKNATFNEIMEHSASGFNGYVTHCSTITLDIVFANPQINWNYEYLTNNPTITSNITNENLRKFAEISSFQLNTTSDEIFEVLQCHIICMYESFHNIKAKIGNKIIISSYMRNPHLQIQELHDFVDEITRRSSYNFRLLLKNELPHSRDNFISTHTSRVLLANMYDERSRIYYETKTEEVLADEYLASLIAKYV
jgi:hypothetical protein